MHQASLKGDFKKAVKWFEELCANSDLVVVLQIFSFRCPNGILWGWPNCRPQPGDFVVDVWAINTVIQAAANPGRVKEATSWFTKIDEYGLNATLESYTSMISATAKKKQIAKAESYFREMQGKGIKPDDVAYGALLAAISRTGDLQRAEKYFTMMERDGLKPNRIVWGNAAGQFKWATFYFVTTGNTKYINRPCGCSLKQNQRGSIPLTEIKKDKRHTVDKLSLPGCP